MNTVAAKFINALIDREAGYVDHPADRGGPTKFGITERVARAFGYKGTMSDMPRSLAFTIYMHQYWADPKFDLVFGYSAAIAEELLDTGANMGVQTASKMLQRALNVLNRGAVQFPDMPVDGSIGPVTLHALGTFLKLRGAEGERVLLRLLNAQQAVRYMEIAEANHSQEAFVYGWVKERVS